MSHDTQLRNAVLAELAWEPSVTAAHIGVTADHGIVTLSGHVESFAQKHAAHAAVSRVSGVKGIAEELEVRLGFDMQRGDDDIAAAAVERLSWDVSVPKDAVKVGVEKGWVTLTGQVDWHYQLEAASGDVRHLMGVRGVTNQVTIKPAVDTATLRDDIQRALHRSIFLDPETVTVAATDGRIILAGTVHNWHDRQRAADTAWAAHGAVAVENNISVI